ncbi:MAG TPA: MoaD/ThiS family protein [Anaerolineae bacterium]|nr:MoaD/ThiS family protein [Anaerolineae bacterium]HQK14526.1 MoaD/ThiS family protein [Anaerolineae bacterium]
MQVNVKLFASLQRYKPGVFAGEAFAVELPEGSTLADLVERLQIHANEVKVMYVNGRARAEMYRLKDGDEVGIFPPVGGG